MSCVFKARFVSIRNKIETHNKVYLKLYPNQSITPKLHALLHLVDQIRLFGPLRYSWCFRYESKNAPFKKIMRLNCNFKNIPYSMASHHQKLVGLNVRVSGEGDFFLPKYVSSLTIPFQASIHFRLKGAFGQISYFSPI